MRGSEGWASGTRGSKWLPEKSFAEIGDALGISDRQAQMIYQNAMKKLRLESFRWREIRDLLMESRRIAESRQRVLPDWEVLGELPRNVRQGPWGKMPTRRKV